MNRWNLISHRQASRLFHRLATGYRAGLDLRTLWQRESETPMPVHSRRAKQVLQGVAEGHTLSEAMSQAGGYFSPLTISVVRAGEASGRLEQSFAKLAKYHEDWHRFFSSVLTQLAWPLFELSSAIIIIGVLILFMGWAMAGSQNAPIDWFGFGWSTQTYFTAYVAAVLLGLSSIAAIYVANQFGVFGNWPTRVLLVLPVIGGILKHTALARFSWSLGAALGAGMEVTESMKLAFAAGRYAPADSAEPQVLADLVEGKSIFESLKRTGRFPADMMDLVGNGEISGELPESLERLSVDYQERVESGLKVLSTLCFVACFLLVAIIMIIAIIFLFTKLVLGPYRDFGLNV